MGQFYGGGVGAAPHPTCVIPAAVGEAVVICRVGEPLSSADVEYLRISAALELPEEFQKFA